MLKTCLQCGVEFKTYNSAVNHCSRKCAIDALRKSVTLTCAYCGASFSRPHARTRKNVTRVFCSANCHRAWRKAQMPFISCAYCGKPFYQKNPAILHCSAKCANDSRVKPHATLVCANCGTSFDAFPSQEKKGRKYCSRKCAVAHMAGPNGAHWRGGKCLQHGRYWERIRELVYERDKVCQGCGAERSPNGRRLDVHHLDPRRDYADQDEANVLSNLVALCAPCHSRLEMAITHNHVAALPIRLQALVSSQ